MMDGKITPETYIEGLDRMIESCKRERQWYLDYRCGSGMTSMLEEFANVLEHNIVRLELIKTWFKNIE